MSRRGVSSGLRRAVSMAASGRPRGGASAPGASAPDTSAPGVSSGIRGAVSMAASGRPWGGASAPDTPSADHLVSTTTPSSLQPRPLPDPDAGKRNCPDDHFVSATIGGEYNFFSRQPRPLADTGKRNCPPAGSALGSRSLLNPSLVRRYLQLSGTISRFGSARRSYTTAPNTITAPITEFGERQYGLDPDDSWLSFNDFFKNNTVFPTVKGHPLIHDNDGARLWDALCKKVFQNMIWLAHSNSKKGACISSSLVPNNLLVSKKSGSVKLIDPVAHIVEYATYQPTTALKSAANLYVDVIKSQSTLPNPEDFDFLVNKIRQLVHVATASDLRRVLLDAALLTDVGYTAALNSVEHLARRAYYNSPYSYATQGRENTLIAFQKARCRGNIDWNSYMAKVPVTADFHRTCYKMGHKHRVLSAVQHQGNINKLTHLMAIQDGHDQLGAMRNTSWHLPEKNSIQRLLKHFNPAVIIPAQTIISPGSVTSPSPGPSLTHPAVIIPAQTIISPGSVTSPSPGPSLTLGQTSLTTALTQSHIAQYHRFHFPTKLSVALDEMDDSSDLCKQDMDREGFFDFDRSRLP